MTRKITIEVLERLTRDGDGDWVWGEDGVQGEPRIRLLTGAPVSWVSGNVTLDEVRDAMDVLIAIAGRLEDEQREREDAALLERLGDLIPDGLSEQQRAAVLREMRVGLQYGLRQVGA